MILEAKLAAENQALCEQLMKIKDPSRIDQMKQALQLQYALLIQNLSAWEASFKSYRATLSATMASRSEDLKAAALKRLQKAKSDFEKARQDWNDLTRSWTLDLQYA